MSWSNGILDLVVLVASGDLCFSYKFLVGGLVVLDASVDLCFSYKFLVGGLVVLDASGDLCFSYKFLGGGLVVLDEDHFNILGLYEQIWGYNVLAFQEFLSGGDKESNTYVEQEQGDQDPEYNLLALL